MSDIKTEQELISKKRELRLRELNKLLADTHHLTTEEYVQMLKEVRHNYTILLTMHAVSGTMKSTYSYLAIIEKIHYLLDTVEGKPTARIDVRHKIQSENRQELRRILTDPRNAKDILEIEGVLLEHMPSPNA